MSKVFIGFWLLILTAAAVYIRVKGVDAYYYHPDELMHLYIAKGNSLRQVLHFSLFETHPPLGHIIRHYWQMLSDTDSTAFSRSLALVFGIALIPLYYYIGIFIQGQVTGICLAAMAAFSHALIIQSYVVRNYSIFIFFLSLGLYAFLKWQQEQSPRNLFLYAISGILACLTHFTGIFAVFCMASYETVRLYGSNRTKMAQWAIINIIIAMVAVAVYHFWSGIIAPFKFVAFHAAFVVQNTIKPSDLFISALFYTLFMFYYVLPCHGLLAAVIPAIIVAATQDIKFRNICLLTAIACGLGMLLVGTGTYQFLSCRRSIWILPFILTCTGCAISDCLLLFANKFKNKGRWLEIVSVCIIAAGFFSYDEKARFSESGDVTGDLKEYSHIPKWEIDKVSHYLSGLDDSYTILLERGDVFLFTTQNPYLYMSWNSLGPESYALMPYYNTHILFPSSYYYDPEIRYIADIQEIAKKSRYLVFISTPFSSDLVLRLMRCENLDKKVIRYSHITLLIMPQEYFYKEIVLRDGKFHACLLRKYETSDF